MQCRKHYSTGDHQRDLAAAAIDLLIGMLVGNRQGREEEGESAKKEKSTM
jgi:hypothetical protein